MCNDVTWPKTSDQVGCHKSFVSEIWSLWNWDLRLPIWESFVRAEIKKINEVLPTWPGCYVNWELYLFVIFKLLREPCYIWAFGLLSEVVLLFICNWLVSFSNTVVAMGKCKGDRRERVQKDKQVQIEIYLYQKLHINRWTFSQIMKFKYYVPKCVLNQIKFFLRCDELNWYGLYRIVENLFIPLKV